MEDLTWVREQEFTARFWLWLLSKVSWVILWLGLCWNERLSQVPLASVAWAWDYYRGDDAIMPVCSLCGAGVGGSPLKIS